METSSSIGRAPAGRVGQSFERFVAAAAAAQGIALSDLSPIDQLEVHTRNSCYRITLLDGAGGRVLVQGGAFFPVPCEAHLSGSSLGGSFLKTGWVGCGFSLEFQHEGQRIVTTRVRRLRRVGQGSPARLH